MRGDAEQAWEILWRLEWVVPPGSDRRRDGRWCPACGGWERRGGHMPSCIFYSEAMTDGVDKRVR